MNRVLEHPIEGQLLPDFKVPSAGGREIRASDYRGHLNLVIALAGGQERAFSRGLLRDLADRYRTITQDEAEVLAIVQASVVEAAEIQKANDYPFPILADRDGRVHRMYGAVAPDGTPAPAVYIADRYGEIFYLCQTSQGERMCTADAVVDWLEYIEIQCPE